MRSESGRYDRALSGDDEHVANVPRASRKDVRDAMAAARKAAGPWAARTAYNRGQILYRAAEALESRADALAEPDEVAAAVDVLVHYAGWTDKLPAVLGGVNPVAAPFLSFSLPEPTGVVGVVAPDEPPLLGLVAEIAPALAAGQHGRRGHLRALAAAGARPRRGPRRLRRARRRGQPAQRPPRGARARRSARHRDLNAIVDAAGDDELAAELDRLAAETVKRARHGAAAASYEAATDDALARLEAVTELKTAWHPIGA